VVVPVSGSLGQHQYCGAARAAVSGVGLWMCAPYIVLDLLASAHWCRCLSIMETRAGDRCAYPHRRVLTAKVRVFIDMLVERFADEAVRLDPTAG